jgi:hypothetical protein
MIHIYYSNTNIESFKKKFHEVVENSDGIFHSYNSLLTGEIHGNTFEVRRGHPSVGDFSLFGPVISGTAHSSGQRTMVSLTSRPGLMGVVMTVITIIMAVVFCVLSLLSDDADSSVRGVTVGILVLASFWLVGLHYYFSRSKELIRDLIDNLDLKPE